MRIALSADHRGVEVFEHLASKLRGDGHDVCEIGPPRSGQCDYPDLAWAVARAVGQGEAHRGILVCGTGMGMCIAANKVDGVRASCVHDELGAEIARRHNDANVLCLAADFLGLRVIDRIVDKWLATGFDGGRHARRLAKIAAIERGIDPRLAPSRVAIGS